MEYLETIIVGGGQAGLAVSYYLKNEGREHIILEKAPKPANAWRNCRWDSFTLVTPNWTVKMPGVGEVADRNGFMPRKDIVKYFEDYIDRFGLPIIYNTVVISIEKTSEGYYITTNENNYNAKNIVIATGFFQKSKVPHFGTFIPKDIKQISSDNYRNPEMIPPGAVLIAGSGQSGCQIAEELYMSGRKVYLSTGCTAGRLPRRYRGKDILEWLDAMGFFQQTFDQMPPGAGKFDGIPHLSGARGGHTLNLHQFKRDNVRLLGHLKGAGDGIIYIEPDLYSNLARIDQFEKNVREKIDSFILYNAIDAPENEIEILNDGFTEPILEILDLKKENISSVIWSCGYTFDYSMIKLPIQDKDGFPVQDRGAAYYPGLYFAGLPWMPGRGTGFLMGIADAAKTISSFIMETEKISVKN